MEANTILEHEEEVNNVLIDINDEVYESLTDKVVSFWQWYRKFSYEPPDLYISHDSK